MSSLSSQALSGLRALTSLDASYTGVRDAGLAHLARLPRLAHLSLDSCNVMDR